MGCPNLQSSDINFGYVVYVLENISNSPFRKKRNKVIFCCAFSANANTMCHSH